MLFISTNLSLCYLCFSLFISSCASFFFRGALGFHLSDDSSPHPAFMLSSFFLPSSSLNSSILSICLRFPFVFSPWLPASLPPAAGGRFRGPGGDDLTVDGAQQQHEPDGSEHFGGRYPMRLRDGHIQERCCHLQQIESQQ